MSSHWQTERAGRKQTQDEDFAWRAVAGYHETMADILREQLTRPRIEPARSRGNASVNKSNSGENG